MDERKVNAIKSIYNELRLVSKADFKKTLEKITDLIERWPNHENPQRISDLSGIINLKNEFNTIKSDLDKYFGYSGELSGDLGFSKFNYTKFEKLLEGAPAGRNIRRS